MRFNSDGSVNIEETYDGNRRFTKEEYVYLWNLFKEIDNELFSDFRQICGFCPVELFLEVKSKEYYESKKNLS